MSKVINYQPTAKQHEALMYLMDQTTDEVLFGGAAGGGKSFLGCAWLIIMCSKYPKSRWLMGRSKLTTLKTTTLKTFFNVCRSFELAADQDYTFNAASNIITFKNGSEILLKDLFHYPSDPEFDSLGSLEIAGAFIDEVAQITSKAREVVKSRIGWKLDDGTEIKPKLYMSCNPNKGFAYRDFYLPTKENRLKDNLKFIPALPTSNSFLPKGRQTSLENLTGIERKRLLLGEWEYDSDPSCLIEYDNIINLFNNIHIVEKDNNGKTIGTKLRDGKTFKDKAISWDVAGKGKDSAVILVWIGLHIVDYKIIPIDDGTLQTATIKSFQQIYNIPNTLLVFDNDGIGQLAGRDFQGSVNFNNGSSPLNKENYMNLKSQCYFKLADSINMNEIYFPLDDDMIVQRLTEELEQVKRKDIDKDGKLAVIPKEQIKMLIGRSPDISDALMLRMYFLIKKTHQNFADAYSFASF